MLEFVNVCSIFAEIRYISADKRRSKSELSESKLCAFVMALFKNLVNILYYKFIACIFERPPHTTTPNSYKTVELKAKAIVLHTISVLDP